MHITPRVNGRVDCSRTIKAAACFAIACDVFAALSIVVFDFQSGGHGEMGSFYHSILGWVLLFAGWGIVTGVGLIQAWRWARISTLVFSGLLTGSGLLGLASLLHLPSGDISGGTLMIVRAVSTLLVLVPVAAGIWWLVFFSRKHVREYFQADRKTA
jgi:hypothetical protein